MFKFNEDLQCYWFNGDTFEPNLNYELVGNLMGLAFYNNMFVDMPVVPVCYKLLLNLEPDLKDMAQWQPELATSLQYIINYKESENNWVKLEDIIERAFVAEKSSFGIREEVELLPGGKNMIVTSENKHEFVRLFIEYEFKKQCEQQLASFKKGFERTVDISVLQTILTPEDLEQMICGQRQLIFKELKEYCKYGNGFNPDCKLIQWFWEIVLEEWDDNQRRLLLAFSTGSDRAPVNGLKSLNFAIIKDVENADNDLKLPTSHTCFNQLWIPEYTRKDILRSKIQMAIQNPTGFGLV